MVSPGQALLDIVPSGDRLIVEAQVDPQDIDIVHKGLDAHVRFTSFSQRNAVPIAGRVILVSADRLTDERSGFSYYLAKIELTEVPREIFNGAELYPGMPAEVMIVTGSRTTLDYLLRPITSSLRRSMKESQGAAHQASAYRVIKKALGSATLFQLSLPGLTSYEPRLRFGGSLAIHGHGRRLVFLDPASSAGRPK
jgi:hypothetical protein